MKDLDKAVLKYYQSRHGACAHYCAALLKVQRAEVSKALQRLKKKNLMTNDGQYWRALSA